NKTLKETGDKKYNKSATPEPDGNRIEIAQRRKQIETQTNADLESHNATVTGNEKLEDDDYEASTQTIHRQEIKRSEPYR
ncbi:hypothetical protein RA282_30055, partial [Pseudomonas syringae pv. tagetis]